MNVQHYVISNIQNVRNEHSLDWESTCYDLKHWCNSYTQIAGTNLNSKILQGDCFTLAENADFSPAKYGMLVVEMTSRSVCDETTRSK